MSVYLSKPAVICALASDAEQLWQKVTHPSQDALKEVRTPSGNTLYAARVDSSNFSHSSARIDMHISRMQSASLLQIEKEIEEAKQIFGADRVAVCVGSCDNASECSVSAWKTYLSTGAFPNNYTLEMQSADYVASLVAEQFELTGPALAFSTACSSSACALIKASQLMRSGLCDAVVAGGVDIASDTTLSGFGSLDALAQKKTNPFSKNREGITLGDASVFFVLSNKPLLQSLPVVLSGYGESADAFHMTSPDPSGLGAESAMKKALEHAHLNASDISYINLHGTGTVFNDAMEAKAVERIFGSNTVACSSTKSLTGHTLGAAAALEAAVCYETLVHNRNAKEAVFPAQVWDKEYDSTLPQLALVDSEHLQKTNKRVRHVMSNSFAFGGSNASLIFSLEESV